MVTKAFPKRPVVGPSGPQESWLDLIWQLIKSDTYTPTLTKVKNLIDASADACPYIRVGNLVVVGIRFAADPDVGGGTATELQISLPIPSFFTSGVTDAIGCVAASTIQQSARISAASANNRLAVEWSATDTDSRVFGGFAIYIIK